MDAKVAGQVVAPSGMCGQSVGVGRHAVVGVAERYQIVSAGVQTGHHHSQIVSFRPTVDKVNHLTDGMVKNINYECALCSAQLGRYLQISGKRCHQFFGVLVNLGVQINVGGVP